jgi:glyoxylase-like metal-dependent hydrolase (beta-lactamase superfamily II)
MTNLVQEWFRVWEDRPGIWVIEEPLHSEQVKSYLVLGEDRAALIDTGMGVGNLRSLVDGITSLPVVVILSHAHNDHIGSAWQFSDVGIHPSESDDLAAGQSAERLAGWFAPSEMSGPLPSGFNPDGYSIPGRTADRFYNDGDTIDLGGRTLEVIHAPGHSRGGLVLIDRGDRTLYSTDVVYLRSLYLLNPDSSANDYLATLERLAALAPSLDRLYPSHGQTPIDPGLIPPMRDAMREIAAGRNPDGIEYDPDIEGGHEDTVDRFAINVHDFGVFRVLVAVQ